MSNPIRDELNRRKWQSRDLESVTLVVRHRGAPNDEVYISGFEIAEIRADGIVKSGSAEEAGTFIPYHRVIELRSPKR